MEKQSEIIEQRRKKMAALRESGEVLFPNDFKVLNPIGEIQDVVQKSSESLGETGAVFVTAGRMMAINRSENHLFCDSAMEQASFRLISARIRLEIRHMPFSNRWILVILLVLKGRCSKPVQENGHYWLKILGFFASPFGLFRRNFMV